MTAPPTARVPVPRDRANDYTREAAERRAQFVRERTGVELAHVTSYSLDPGIASGNIEQFLGVAQVPIGLARWNELAGHLAKLLVAEGARGIIAQHTNLHLPKILRTQTFTQHVQDPGAFLVQNDMPCTDTISIDKALAEIDRSRRFEPLTVLLFQ